MVKEFTAQELNILIDGVDNLDRTDLVELIQCFPFENMINISIINYDLMRLHLKLLIKLSQYDEFYSNKQAVTYSLEFTVANLLSLENVQVDEILFNLLELMKYVISKIKLISEYTQNLLKARERLFNTMTFTTKLKIFRLTHVPNCTEILCDLLMINGPLPLTTSRNLAEISEIYKGLNVVYELAVICNIVIKKFTISTEVFNVCTQWLLNYGPSLLQENHDDHTVLELLTVMNEFHTKYCYIKSIRHQNSDLLEAFNGFILDLTTNSDKILNMASKPILKTEALRLFAILFSSYGDEDIDLRENPSVVLDKLLEFPPNIHEWPQIKSEIFFHICSFLYTHSSEQKGNLMTTFDEIISILKAGDITSLLQAYVLIIPQISKPYEKLIWSSSDIIMAISSFIYSYDKFSIDLPLLKPLCYIFPVLMPDCLNKTTLLLGDEILTILMKFPYGFSKVLTYHIAQLVWILKRGESKLKKYVLSKWLVRDQEVEVLGKAIVQCKGGSILLDIIVDCRAEELARDKAIQMTHTIKVDGLSKDIAMMIPTTLHSEDVLYRLILSNPGIPDNTELAIKLCMFMSMVLVLIVDEKVLTAACSYCKLLITNLKRQNDIVILFCQEIQNIKFLAIKVKYVRDETAVEILRLLKVLILVQNRNHSRIEEKVELDLSQSLVGSHDKVEKCLDLLQIIVSRKDVFLQLEDLNIQKTFLNLFQLSKDSAFAKRSFICLTKILKSNNGLAYAYSTNLFIEVQCSLAVDEESGPEFVMFLQIWIQILRHNVEESAYYVPNKMTVMNYIKRAGFLYQKKVDYLLQLVSKLKIYPDTLEARQRTFGQLCIK